MFTLSATKCEFYYLKHGSGHVCLTVLTSSVILTHKSLLCVTIKAVFSETYFWERSYLYENPPVTVCVCVLNRRLTYIQLANHSVKWCECCVILHIVHVVLQKVSHVGFKFNSPACGFNWFV